MEQKNNTPENPSQKQNATPSSFVEKYVSQYDELRKDGAKKTAILDGLEQQKRSPTLAFLKGGTVLGSSFALAAPFLQAVKPASKWQTFRATAPKAAALGFAVGAVGNLARAFHQNDQIDGEKERITIMIDAVELERAKNASVNQSERSR